MLLFVFLVFDDVRQAPGVAERQERSLKLYWFIPDGLRAEPVLFRVYEWAREGKLPNIARMLERGSRGYSVPVFPGHTPTNFATLLTGAFPTTHGVADGPMRLERYPLSVVSKSGFSSHAKRVPPIWFSLEQQGYRVALLSVPGSTPPELSEGITIKGRWGGWGIDFASRIFHGRGDVELRHEQGLENRLFEQGQELTSYVDARPADGWTGAPRSYGVPREIELPNWGTPVFAYLYDSSDDGVENHDRVAFSLDRAALIADLGIGEWSEWLPVQLHWQTANDYNIHTPKKPDWELELGSVPVQTSFRIKVMRLDAPDGFRIRFLYDGLNRFLSKPTEYAQRLVDAAGPMVDYPDNFPPQLIYFPEDRQTFLDEMRQSLEWHRKAARFLVRHANADVIIHDIYTPNQMLTSRWWLGYLDPASPRYGDVDDAERRRLWDEVLEMYRGIDAIIGEVMDTAPEDTAIVLSSDHGAVPLHTNVLINNLLAREGLLHYRIDEETGYPHIDWERTQAVFLKMDNVYINPQGLGGDYHRAEGEAYRALRRRVVELLTSLEAPDGSRPLARVVTHEDAHLVDLPADRVGDLVIANAAGFGWSESITAGGEVFERARVSGYKQAVIPDDEQGMWTPFIIVGPGIRRGGELAEPLRHVDQYPTIMRMLGATLPDHVEGSARLDAFD